VLISRTARVSARGAQAPSPDMEWIFDMLPIRNIGGVEVRDTGDTMARLHRSSINTQGMVEWHR